MTQYERCPECAGAGVVKKSIFNTVEDWNRRFLIAFGILGILGLELQGLGISFMLIIAWFPIYYAGWLLLSILIATRILKRHKSPRKLTPSELKLLRQQRDRAQNITVHPVTVEATEK